MKIGTLGAGVVAQAIARHALAQGHQVVLANSRGPESLSELIDQLGPGARAGTREEAASAELVILAVGWPAIPAALSGLPDWDGRIVVDATNQFEQPPPQAKIADLGEVTGSEYVAALLPGAVVIKAFNTLYGPYIAADPRHPAGRQVLFYAGDDTGPQPGSTNAMSPKRRFAAVAEQFGFAPVDLGGLRDGGRLMQLGGPLSGLHALKQD